MSFALVGCGRIAFDRTPDAGIADASDGGVVPILDCVRGTFCRESAPTTQDLYSVWARTVDDVWAVGRGGSVLHRTNGTWQVVASGSTDWLVGVWAAPDADLAIAVGENARRIRFDDGAMSESTSGGMFLNAVWGFDSTRIYIVGEAGVLMRGDGTNWVDDSAGVAGSLSSVWGTSSPDDVWVGSYGNDLFRSLSGSAWSVQDPPPNSDDWFAGWSASATDVWTFGYSVERFNGTSWTSIPVNGFTSVIAAMHGLDGEVWFTSQGGTGVFTGTAVEPLATPITEDMHDVHGTGGVLWFVGDGGAIYVHQP